MVQAVSDTDMNHMPVLLVEWKGNSVHRKVEILLCRVVLRRCLSNKLQAEKAFPLSSAMFSPVQVQKGPSLSSLLSLCWNQPLFGWGSISN